MPWTSIMPTGGVKPEKESLEKWFGAGVHCVGLGSQLFPKEVIEKEDFTWIKNKVEETLKMVKELK